MIVDNPQTAADWERLARENADGAKRERDGALAAGMRQAARHCWDKAGQAREEGR